MFSTAGAKSPNTIWKSLIETKFRDLLRSTGGKQRLPSYHYPRRRWSSFLNKGGRGNHMVHGCLRGGEEGDDTGMKNNHRAIRVEKMV
jgi:hypothetical protein